MPEETTDRRHAHRRRVALEGVVVWNGGRLKCDCAVRDLGETGARLVFRGAALDVDSFTFALDGETSRPAHRVWSAGREMGIEFDRP